MLPPDSWCVLDVLFIFLAKLKTLISTMSRGGSGRLKTAFAERRVQKEYRAIAAGTSTRICTRIDLEWLRYANTRRKMTYDDLFREEIHPQMMAFGIFWALSCWSPPIRGLWLPGCRQLHGGVQPRGRRGGSQQAGGLERGAVPSLRPPL